MINFNSIQPIIKTHQMEETIMFYRDVLGFSLREFHHDWNWAAISKGECELMISGPNTHQPFDKPQFTGSFYISVDDVDGLWLQVKDMVKVCYEPETFEWGMREFGIFDNNGYLLQFGQDMKPYL